MAKAVTFQAVLQRIGFSKPAVAALVAKGLTTTPDLIWINERDKEQILNSICTGPPPIVVPYLAQKCLVLCAIGSTAGID